MYKKLKLVVSPFFITKYFILKDLKDILKNNKITGNILDIGCGEKPYQAIFPKDTNYVGIDFTNFSLNNDFNGTKPDFFFNEDYMKNFILPFSDEEFDNIVAFEVLEHHESPAIFASEIFRLLKKNGFCLITVPFLYGVHEAPFDFQRFTKFGLISLFKKAGFTIIECRSQGGLFTTVSLLFNQYLDGIAKKGCYWKLLISVIYLPFLLFSYISIILDKIFICHDLVSHYTILLRK